MNTNYKSPTSNERYNGHKNWTHWNVSLWAYNDEGIYRLMLDSIKYAKSYEQAAENMIEVLPKRTPDGALFTVDALVDALSDLDEDDRPAWSRED